MMTQRSLPVGSADVNNVPDAVLDNRTFCCSLLTPKNSTWRTWELRRQALAATALRPRTGNGVCLGPPPPATASPSCGAYPCAGARGRCGVSLLFPSPSTCRLGAPKTRAQVLRQHPSLAGCRRRAALVPAQSTSCCLWPPALPPSRSSGDHVEPEAVPAAECLDLDPGSGWDSSFLLMQLFRGRKRWLKELGLRYSRARPGLSSQRWLRPRSGLPIVGIWGANQHMEDFPISLSICNSSSQINT